MAIQWIPKVNEFIYIKLICTPSKMAPALVARQRAQEERWRWTSGKLGGWGLISCDFWEEGRGRVQWLRNITTAWSENLTKRLQARENHSAHVCRWHLALYMSPYNKHEYTGIFVQKIIFDSWLFCVFRQRGEKPVAVNAIVKLWWGYNTRKGDFINVGHGIIKVQWSKKHNSNILHQPLWMIGLQSRSKTFKKISFTDLDQPETYH